MVQVTELGYLGIGVKSLGDWKGFASEIVGLEVVDGETSDRCYLRADNWHHRLIVDEDGTDDLGYLGFRVSGADEFREMARQLADAGVKARIGTDEEARERHVLEVMKLEDPSGNRLEIFHGPHIQPHKPFHPGRRMHGRFKTGDGGLGHLILRETVGFDKTYQFYRLLGMRGGVEYRIPVPGRPRALEILFMHCNIRDHTVAFGLPDGKRINHLMLEVEEFDDVGLCYEVVKENKVPVGIAPGRHANDHMWSFYFVNPSGWMIETGWGGRPATHQSEYYERDLYGHERQVSGPRS
jgi:2,3-dihydroxyethylbenzene 1,2-dioxygenase